ncbi:hypothetical protein DUNSADRAFT_2626 [Dunaliella salina]|uniref:Ionotropic glutamate receptor C-terminal domain-containing protein n=1 Tax=Dunaliella salina TaxID=3046 RepID=A0ABQ7GVE6_DUNSA|nr:hypothetical protein DUNSADRAFT_2626 [Dunaliella salina]|eukprot:KAF5838565.1 hypothetical protein DUNSADRAFT_2626 [Dunaliella salina]
MVCHAFILFFVLASPSIRLVAASTVRNWCPVQENFNGTTTGALAQALRGQMLNVAAFEYPPFAYIQPETGEWAGFDIELFKMVAEQADFKFNITMLRQPAENETYNTILYIEGREFDMLVSWVDETSARKRHFFSFSLDIVDMSFMLVTTNPKPTDPPFEDYFFMFLKPFERDVWLVLLFGVVFTGIFLYILEPSLSEAAEDVRQRYEDGSPESLPAALKRHAFGFMDLFQQGWLLFTIQENYAPKRWWTKLYLMSWTGVTIVMVAMYTSQLTYFLIVELTSTTAISSLEDLISSGKAVCTLTNEEDFSSYLRRNAPSVPIYGINTLGEAFPAIRNGSCAAALLGKAEIEVELSINEACDMRAVGDHLTSMSGAYTADMHNCGEFPLRVVDATLQQMREGEEIEDLWSNYIQLPQECVGKLGSTTESDSVRIHIKQVGGLFILHLAIASVCLCGFMLAHARKSATKEDGRLVLSATNKANAVHPSRQFDKEWKVGEEGV